MPESQILSTLLYCFNREGEVLLMERAQEPNLGLWSPCGGKLDRVSGESPHQNAAREAAEELGIRTAPVDFHLVGLVTEQAEKAGTHWLMFLLELIPPLDALPPAHREGRFQFFKPEQVGALPMPATDREKIWPLFWEHRGGFFAASCRCTRDGNHWTLEQSRRPAGASTSIR